MTNLVTTDNDTIDVADLVRSVRRGWRFVLGGLVFGALLAWVVLVVVPARFHGVSTIVVKAPESGAASLASKLGGSLQSAASSLLPGASSLTASPIETEIQVLSSRAVASEVVDSLGLQLRVRGDERRASSQVFAAASFPGAFKRKRLHIERKGPDSFLVSSGNTAVTARPGVPVQIAGGTLTLASDSIPAKFDVDVYDREEAATRFQERLSVSKPGGEVLSVAYQAYDSLTAAAVPNLVIRRYLERRHTTDRGVNARRVEFLASQVDSTEKTLTAAERALRNEQEKSGVIDPTIVGKLELEQASELRKTTGELDIERGAVNQLLSQLASGQLTSRQLAAYPTFLKSPAVNELLSQLSELETKRLQLKATLTDQAPEVVAATEGIRNIESQLAPLARAYAQTLDKQRSDMTKQLDTLRGSIASLPATSESALRLQRDVLRMSQINAAVRAQLVDAKLAAIGEGGDVRLLDIAEPPRKVAFPTKPMAIGGGLGVGLLFGVFAAILAGIFGRYVADARTIERRLGVPALHLDADTPLALAGASPSHTILLVPLDAEADTAGVAQRIMRTAIARGLRGTVLDLSAASPDSHIGNGTITNVSTEFDMVAVQMPRMSSDATLGALTQDRAVLFVATAGRVDRRGLETGIETLKRLGVPCAGVVLSRRDRVLLRA